MRAVGSSAAAARNASASSSSSASEAGNPKIRCRSPRAVSTSTSGWTASGSSPMRIQVDALAGFRAGAGGSGFLPAGSRSGRPLIDWVVRCWLCCAASLVSTFRVCWSPSAPSSRVASSSIRPSSRRRTVWVRAGTLLSSALPDVLAPDCRGTSTGDARTGRWAGRAFARPPAEERRNRAGGPRRRRRRRLR